jgi:hypothetical protein
MYIERRLGNKSPHMLVSSAVCPEYEHEKAVAGVDSTID